MTEYSVQRGHTVQYRVALSFAGEDRDYVEAVAVELRNLGIQDYFLDSEHEAELWGQNLVEYLQRVYLTDSEYVVVFISSHYASKQWTRHELRSAMARALQEKREYVLPVKFDDTQLEGVLNTVAYIDARAKDPGELASLIAAKVRHVSSEKREAVEPVALGASHAQGSAGRPMGSLDRLACTVLESAADPKKEPSLARALVEEAQTIAEQIPDLLKDLAVESKEDVGRFVESAASLVGSLSNALAKLGYFAGTTKVRFISDAMERVGQTCSDEERKHPTGGLGLLPATLVAYAAVSGACLGEQADLAAALLLKPRLLATDGSRSHWVTQFNTLTTFGDLERRGLVPGNYISQYGGAMLVSNALGALPFAQLASCHDRFVLAFETAEYAIGLACQLFHEESTYWSVPAGTLVEHFTWRSDDRRREAVLESIAEFGLMRALLQRGLQGVDSKQLSDADTAFQERLHKYGHSIM